MERNAVPAQRERKKAASLSPASLPRRRTRIGAFFFFFLITSESLLFCFFRFVFVASSVVPPRTTSAIWPSRLAGRVGRFLLFRLCFIDSIMKDPIGSWNRLAAE